MRIVSRTARAVREQEREKAMRKREAAGTLANSFPRVGPVRINLQRVAQTDPVPADRTHALYSSAQGYFEFACPHGARDGSIDLNAVTLALRRGAGPRTEGTLRWPGTRTGGTGARPPCNLRVDYWIDARYQSLNRAAG